MLPFIDWYCNLCYILWEQFEENAEFFDGTVLDISGGGMRFNSVLPRQTGEFLLLRPDLPAQIRSELPLLLARLISSQPTKSRQEVYENRVEYIHLLPGIYRLS